MSVTLIVITDGRDTLGPTLASAAENLRGDFTRRILVNDAGDAQTSARLHQELGGIFEIVSGPRTGFAGAVRKAWAQIDPDDGGYVFHLEDDFTFERPVDVDAMTAVLVSDPRLVQVALKRQPVNHVELDAGGVVECWPDEWKDHDHPHPHLTASLWFTTNPSLYRTDLTRRGWPDCSGSEAEFARRLPAGWRMAYMGNRTDPPWVRHIGDTRHPEGLGY